MRELTKNKLLPIVLPIVNNKLIQIVMFEMKFVQFYIRFKKLLKAILNFQIK